MRVLVGCEYSGIVRDAFIENGCDALSCDLLPGESPGPHYQGDIFGLLTSLDEWDLVILHPPCTAMAVSGNRWYAGTDERKDAITWTLRLWDAAVFCSRAVALENPVGALSTAWRKPDQYIQPWQFGHGETKKTGLWLYNLPLLEPTDIVEGREPRIHHMAPSEDRGKERSRFYPGIAKAMAEQWTNPPSYQESDGPQEDQQPEP